MRQLTAPASAPQLLQRSPETTASTSLNTAAIADASEPSLETLDKLVQQVYLLICQRLTVERERHGLGPRF
jgi:hypothetical protein